jgi:ABC-2 type transport system ATP-binding protein
VDVVVECHGLVRRYGSLTAVDGLNLAIRAGEFFALLGPNGAGKTTAMHVLSTLLPPSAGEVRVLGLDVVREASAVRRSVGVVFQDNALDERLSAWENLHMHTVLYNIPSRQRRERIHEALVWASLDHARDRVVRGFSGGMKRRLELARALLHEPKLLILDEPTLRLDPQGRRHLWERIEALRRAGMTVVMTTHYLHEAASCDRVAIMDRGRLVIVGEPQALVASTPGAHDLESVFLALTGRDLRDGDPLPPASQPNPLSDFS